MWFKNPDSAKRIFAKYPEERNNLIAKFLFMGCLTGRKLRQAFGEELCDAIIWEEAHSEIGGASASRFGFDAAHIQGAIHKHEPDIVLAFGRIAGEGLLASRQLPFDHAVGYYAIFGPHPASRQGGVMTELKGMADDLKARLNHAPAVDD
jgi:hypothetical protein